MPTVTKERLAKLEAYRNLLTLAMREGQDQYIAVQRELCRRDLFYLFVFVLGRHDGNNDWVFARCREVQENPDGYADLWSRGHYKSSIITFALTIQDILKNPEETIVIISYSKTMAESFLSQIKLEFENNIKLKRLFPDILYDNPSKEADKWSVKDGFSVKRKGNPKEQTVEAYGLVDSQPTGKHFRIQVFDDIVTDSSVTSADMIYKTTSAWEAALNIGADTDVYRTRRRYIGTRWHHADTWADLMARRAVIPRIYPCTEDGTLKGKSVFLPKDVLMEKYRDMKARTFNAQMLLNPTPEESSMFRREFLRHWDADTTTNLNIYIVVDPSNKTKKQTERRRGDFTAMWVVGLGADQNYYVLDIIRDKLNLRERAITLFKLHEKWRPISVGYETGAMSADIEFIKEEMTKVNYRFSIVELPNNIGKADRIENLEPLFQRGRIWLPNHVWITDFEGKRVDLVDAFINEEFLQYPYAKHDDMLDALSYILHRDLGAVFPQSGSFNYQAGQFGIQENYGSSGSRGDYDPLNWNL